MRGHLNINDIEGEIRRADRSHLAFYARRLFPSAKIRVGYPAEEVIDIDVDGRRFTFEIGSDDDSYVFTDGETTFEIPLMANPDTARDFA